jgi:hypothetical protein
MRHAPDVPMTGDGLGAQEEHVIRADREIALAQQPLDARRRESL